MDERSSHCGNGLVPRTHHNTLVMKNSLALAPVAPDAAEAVFQFHCLEQAAYAAVLRAFYAQSDLLSWDREELLTELRNELRVSDVEHREVLLKASSDESIKSLRKLALVSNAHLTEADCAFDAHKVVPDKNVKTGHVSTSSLNCSPCAQQSRAPVHAISSSRDFGMVNNSCKTKLDPCFDHHVVVPAKRFKLGHVRALASPNYPPSAEQLPALAPTLPVEKSCRDRFGGKTLSHEVKFAHTLSPIYQKHNQSNAGHAQLRIHQDSQASNQREAEMPVMQRSKSVIVSRDGNLEHGSDIIKLRSFTNILHEVDKLCGENRSPANLETAKLILKEHEKHILDALHKLAADGDNPPVEQQNHHEDPKAQMVGRRCHRTVY